VSNCGYSLLSDLHGSHRKSGGSQGLLRRRLSGGKLRQSVGKVQKEAHESNPICVRVRIDVSRQISSRHPLRCNLEGVGSCTCERDDVGVFEPLPHQSFPVKHLLGSSANNVQPSAVTSISLCGHIRAAGGSDPQPLDANVQVTVCPCVYIGKTTGGEGVIVDVQGFVRKRM